MYTYSYKGRLFRYVHIELKMYILTRVDFSSKQFKMYTFLQKGRLFRYVHIELKNVHSYKGRLFRYTV